MKLALKKRDLILFSIVMIVGLFLLYFINIDSSPKIPNDYCSFIELLEKDLEQIKSNVSPKRERRELSEEEALLLNEAIKSMKLEMEIIPNDIEAIQLIGKNKLVFTFSTFFSMEEDSYFGFIVVERFKGEYKIIAQDKESFSFDYFGWEEFIEEYGDVDFEPVNLMHHSSIYFESLEIEKKDVSCGWQVIDFNPFLLGHLEKKPEDNSIYFGLYKDKPAFFVSNEYLTNKYLLSENQGIVKMFGSEKNEENKVIDFIDLKNQLWVMGYGVQVIDIIDLFIVDDFLHFVIQSSHSGKEGNGLINREWKVAVDIGPVEHLKVEWVYNLNGKVKQLEVF